MVINTFSTVKKVLERVLRYCLQDFRPSCWLPFCELPCQHLLHLFRRRQHIFARPSQDSYCPGHLMTCSEMLPLARSRLRKLCRPQLRPHPHVATALPPRRGMESSSRERKVGGCIWPPLPRSPPRFTCMAVIKEEESTSGIEGNAQATQAIPLVPAVSTHHEKQLCLLIIVCLSEPPGE